MSDSDVRSYSLSCPMNGRPIWLDLCPGHLQVRLEHGASVMDKRRPVTVTACQDCQPEATLR